MIADEPTTALDVTVQAQVLALLRDVTPSLACTHFRIQFRGVAAHAAKNPEQGRNALAAVILFFVATGPLRQHIGDGARAGCRVHRPK